MKGELGTEKVFLSGDFNAYTREDPMQRLYDNGYTDIGSDQSPDEHTYLYDGHGRVARPRARQRGSPARRSPVRTCGT